MPSGIMQAIRAASTKTGVDFAYLVNKANQESGFNANAQSTTSSAQGLYQFTSQTWLQMIKEHGSDYGLGQYADHITIDTNGTAHVSDNTWKQAILNLRKDPQTSALMAGELDKTNRDKLLQKVGGKIGATEMYLAHFLGATGATTFLQNLKNNPSKSGASILPQAAAANTTVFYTTQGQAKSLKEIYQKFADKFVKPAPQSIATSAAPVNSQSIQMASLYTPVTTTRDAPPRKNDFTLKNNDFITNSQSIHAPSKAYSSIKAPGATSLYANMVMAQLSINGTSSVGIFHHENKKSTSDVLSNLA